MHEPNAVSVDVYESIRIVPPTEELENDKPFPSSEKEVVLETHALSLPVQMVALGECDSSMMPTKVLDSVKLHSLIVEEVVLETSVLLELSQGVAHREEAPIL